VRLMTKLAVVAALLHSGIASAQTAAPVPTAARENVASLLGPIREQHKLPALAAIVIDGDEIIAQGAVGFRSNGSPEAAAVDDQWHIGSCTKSMTATAIALLVEHGTMSWALTVGEAFPELTMDPAWKGVTVEQLLTNHGGAPANLDADGLWERLWKFSGTPGEARMMLVKGVTSRPPEAPPGTKFIYSNAGFAIAGAMAERAANRPWEDLMRDVLFQPLGMASAGYGPPGDMQPRGHRSAGGEMKPVEPGAVGADNPVAIAPAGLVHCSLPDWGKYASFHLRLARGQAVPESLALSPENIARLHTPAPPDGTADEGYAMGWGITRREWGGRLLTHSGSNTMWFAVLWLAPEKNFAILVTTNAGGNSAARGADEAVGALIKWRLASMPAPEAGQEKPDQK
jgi:CubicO group peptidase (beta-lactamase class C family)